MIVVTTDLSRESTQAFAPVRELASKLGSSVVLLHIVEDLAATPHGAPFAPPQSSPELSQDVREATTRLQELAADLGDDVRLEVVTAQDTGKAIARYATEHDATLIALASHGRGGIRNVLLGSVATDVLQHATVPVLCVPLRGQGS